MFIGIRDITAAGPCEVFYQPIGEGLTREEKLATVDAGNLNSIEWQHVVPNAYGDWVGQRSDEFLAWPVLGDKSGGSRVFVNYSAGLKTSRDSWCCNFSRKAVEDNIGRMVDFYNSQVEDFARHCEQRAPANRKEHVDAFIDTDPTKISWNRGTKHDLAREKRYPFRADAIVRSVYRPFQAQHVYFDRQLNDMIYQLPSMFPTQHHRNTGFLVLAPRDGTQFATLATDLLPDLSFFTYTAQFFPRWTYELVEADSGTLDFAESDHVDEYGYRRVDNITDEILALYRGTLGDRVTKDDIFYSVYGQLHVPSYRETYAADLKKMLPHIPTPETIERFEQLATAGRALAELHVNYESVDPYPLEVLLKAGSDPGDRETWRVQKLKWKSKTDHSTIIYNPRVTIASIPEEAERYMLGSRSALAWIIDRYQVKTDKASGIVNDPNDWCDERDDPTYILDLIKKVTTVAVETTRIVDSL